MDSLRSFFSTLLYHGLEGFGKYYSNYEAIVVDDKDPEHRGRLKVIIPNITGEKPHPKWATPLGIYAGKEYGLFLLPSIGDVVEIAFDFGDPRFPRWQHSGWQLEELPKEFQSGVYGLKTPSGHTIKLSDLDNILEITHKDGSFLRFEKERIIIEYGDGKTLVTSGDEFQINHKKQHITISGGKIEVQFDGKPIIKLDGDGLVFDEGKNKGIPLVEPLIEKMNALENAMNDIVKSYSAHVHTESKGGVTTSATVPYTKKPIKNTTVSELENPRITQ